MSRMKDITTEALLRERESSWGDPVITHRRIAQVWSTLLAGKLIKPIEAHEVAACMSGMKLVRNSINPGDPDSLDDADAYNEISRRCYNSYAPAASGTVPAEDDFPCCSQSEEWFEVPLPGFAQSSASPRFGALVRGKLVDQDEGPNE